MGIFTAIFGLNQKQIDANFTSREKSKRFFLEDKSELFNQYNRKYIGSIYSTCNDIGSYEYTELILEEVNGLKRIALYFDMEYEYPCGYIYTTKDLRFSIDLSFEYLSKPAPHTVGRLKKISKVDILLKSNDINIREFNQVRDELIKKRSILNLNLERMCK